MAYKTLALVLVNLLLVSASDTDPEAPCNCSNDVSVWKFLQALSKDVAEEDRDLYSVFPGELSPLIDCGCESERRKRKVKESDDPPMVDSPPEVESSPEDDSEQKVRAKKSLHRDSCPQGLVKFGTLCVEDTTDY